MKVKRVFGHIELEDDTTREFEFLFNEGSIGTGYTRTHDKELVDFVVTMQDAVRDQMSDGHNIDGGVVHD